MTPADRLRAAATKVREQAAKVVATSGLGPWVAKEQDCDARVHTKSDGAIANLGRASWPGTMKAASWIALMGPQIAEPLAAWLDETAINYDADVWAWDEKEAGSDLVRKALVLADRILGTP